MHDLRHEMTQPPNAPRRDDMRDYEGFADPASASEDTQEPVIVECGAKGASEEDEGGQLPR